ncbi:RraA family protein [Streptomyces sp. NBC_00829]|uniref:RraA family protein n=1 Tax=Streptomyces sp. NBC_00829 TaxID=2903679 RepID=UPI0038679B05|nr:hypothetical protein OG293_05900 [Streptomyces sp. NBC_00829]
MSHTDTGQFGDPLVLRITDLDVCCISDAMDSLGLAGVAEGLTPMWQGAKAAGRAVTTKLAPGEAPADAPPVHLGAQAVERSQRGSVIVVDNGGRSSMGAWGGLLSMAASIRGVAGVVMDGACRDVDEARLLGFPAFARAAATRTARGRVHEQACGEPVQLGGVTVESGDIVVADGSGVVVVPAGHAERVIESAEKIARREKVMQDRLRGGEPVAAVLGASYEHMLRPQ